MGAPEWRCISYWQWRYYVAMLVFGGSRSSNPHFSQSQLMPPLRTKRRFPRLGWGKAGSGRFVEVMVLQNCEAPKNTIYILVNLFRDRKHDWKGNPWKFQGNLGWWNMNYNLARIYRIYPHHPGCEEILVTTRMTDFIFRIRIGNPKQKPVFASGILRGGVDPNSLWIYIYKYKYKYTHIYKYTYKYINKYKYKYKYIYIYTPRKSNKDQTLPRTGSFWESFFQGMWVAGDHPGFQLLGVVIFDVPGSKTYRNSCLHWYLRGATPDTKIYIDHYIPETET